MGIKKLWKWLNGHLRNRFYPAEAQTIPSTFIDDRRTHSTICLADLPPEMYQNIASFLPLASAAAFALCSRRISRILGTQYWKALGSWRDAGGLTFDEALFYDTTIEPQGGERADFLALLERDLPDYIFCARCARLHMPIFKRHSTVDDRRICAKADYCGTLAYSLPYHLRFSLLQWTMKQSRMGLDCSEQLQFFFETELDLQRARFPERLYSPPSLCYSVKEARIRAGKYLLRVQEWCILPVKEVSISSWNVDTKICPHFVGSDRDKSLKQLVTCKMHHWRNRVLCTSCTGLQQCRCCFTEFQIDVKEYGIEEVALVITRWLDLGECLSPMDPKWSRRRATVTVEPGLLWARESVQFTPGSIKNLFEDGEIFLFQSIIHPSTERELFSPLDRVYKYRLHQ